MRSIAFVFLAALLSCGRTENAYNQLDGQERENLRLRAQTKCLTENDSAFRNFKKLSAEAMFSSDTFERHANWKFKLVNDASATTNEKEGNIQVWNRGADFIVFYVDYIRGGSKDFFVRLDKAQHDLMIDDLKEDFCTRGTTATFQTGASISTSGPISVTFKYRTGASDSKISDYYDTYSYNFQEPIFFAGFHMKRRQVQRNIDADGDIDETDTNATTTNWTSSLVGGILPEWQYNYDNGLRYAQKFCTFQQVNSQYRVTNNPTDDLGYPLPDVANATICPSSLPAGWNMDITNQP